MKLPLISPVFRLAMRIVSALVWTVTVFAAYGGHFNPDHFTIPAVLCLGFPYLAMASGLLVVFWAISGRIVFTVAGVAVLACCGGALSESFPLSSSRKAPEGAKTFKIMSWNVIHTQDLRKPDYPGNRALEYMIASGADVIGLAELKNFGPDELQNASPALIDSLIRIYPFRAGLSSTDIKVLSKYPVDREGLSYISLNGQQRFDFFKIHFPGGKKLTLAMVHLYSYDLSEEERKVVTDMKSVDAAKSSVRELKGTIRSKLGNAFHQRASNAEELRAAINRIRPSAPLIVCGDFNDVPSSWTYRLIKGDDMRDAYVETNFGPAWTYNLHMFYFHIDQMLYRGRIEALDLDIGKINSSDHYPLIGTFAFTE